MNINATKHRKIHREVCHARRSAFLMSANIPGIIVSIAKSGNLVVTRTGVRLPRVQLRTPINR